MKEYRAVFKGPGIKNGSYGPPRSTLTEAMIDKPERSEETLQYLVGVETREAVPWEAVPLATIVKESGAAAT